MTLTICAGRSLPLGELSASARRAQANPRYYEHPFELTTGFESQEDLEDFLKENEIGLNAKAVRVIEHHLDQVIGTVEKRLFIRRRAYWLGIQEPVSFERALALAQEKKLIVPPWAAISLMAKLVGGEVGEYMRVMMMPLVTNGKLDMFDLHGAPLLKAVPVMQVVHPNQEFFFAHRQA